MEMEPDPSGCHESSLHDKESNKYQNESSRSDGSLIQKTRFLALIVIALLCLLQLVIGMTFLSSTTIDEAYNRLMDLPTTLQIDETKTEDDDTMKQNTAEYIFNITTPQPLPTLVHFDPRFLGGYRNQHMRFVAFVNFAVQNSIPQLLLPSLRWGVAQGEQSGNSVPFDYLFDVAYWNEHAEREGLPLLVRYDSSVLEGRRITGVIEPISDIDNTTDVFIECFNTSSNLYSGLDEHIIRNPKTNIRKVSPQIWNDIGKLDGYSHCKRPPKIEEQIAEYGVGDGDKFTYLIPHGGSKGVGRLWEDYNRMQRQRGKAKQSTIIGNRTMNIHPEHLPVERAINTILRPSEAIRKAIKSAINSVDVLKQQKPKHTETIPQFLALHPRIEHDMLQHRCSRFMEQNLTKVFDHLRGEVSHDIDLLFLAVNIELTMAEPSSKLQHDIRKLAIENQILLNLTRTYGLFGNDTSPGIPMFESGSRTAENILFPAERPNGSNTLVSAKSLGITDLVASVVNFFTIVEAEKFVGVKGSSFSTDLFAVRYYMGKGNNYILNSEGVTELHGPPPGHSCN